MRRHNADRGAQVGAPFVEAFTMHRGHPFPHYDLLAEMFGGKWQTVAP
jgi:hypothetical protein